jgi:Domain of unknown function (DUF4276)
MKAAHFEFLVEEPSMEEMLRLLLPKILQDQISFEIYRSQSKDDLLSNLPARLRGYSTWLPASWRIFVLVDRDDDDCIELKKQLEKVAKDSYLTTKTKALRKPYQVINRIAIEELEAWFFGDMEAVRAAYPKVSIIEKREKYRDPDNVKGGTWESFEKVLQDAGYFKGGLRKIELARTIAPYLVPDRNRSKSFQVFYETIIEIMNEPAS